MSNKRIMEIEDRITDVDLRLQALEAGLAPTVVSGPDTVDVRIDLDALREQVDALEMKVDLARPGKKTQRG